MYGVVDVYGQCGQVTIVGNHSYNPQQHENRVNTPNTHGPPLETPTAPQLHSGLNTFHERCGKNIILLEGNLSATRVNSYSGGILFSSRPLTIGEVFKVSDVKVILHT